MATRKCGKTQLIDVKGYPGIEVQLGCPACGGTVKVKT